jgi:hypothetical protein
LAHSRELIIQAAHINTLNRDEKYVGISLQRDRADLNKNLQLQIIIQHFRFAHIENNPLLQYGEQQSMKCVRRAMTSSNGPARARGFDGELLFRHLLLIA